MNDSIEFEVIERIFQEGALFQGPIEPGARTGSACADCGASADEAMHTSDKHDLCPRCLRPNARVPL
jgi:hypothetical protein